MKLLPKQMVHAALRSPEYSFLTLKRDARLDACHKSYSICMPSQVSGSLPNALERRIAISGEMPEWTLISYERALRVTPKARAAAVTLRPSGARHSSRTNSPGCGGLCIRMFEPHLLNDSPPNRHRLHLHQQSERQVANYQKLKPPIAPSSPLSADADGNPATTSPRDLDCGVTPGGCASVAGYAELKRLSHSLRQRTFRGLCVGSSGSSSLVTYRVTNFKDSNTTCNVDAAVQLKQNRSEWP